MGYTQKKFLLSRHSPQRIVLESLNLGQRKGGYNIDMNFLTPFHTMNNKLLSHWYFRRSGEERRHKMCLWRRNAYLQESF